MVLYFTCRKSAEEVCEWVLVAEIHPAALLSTPEKSYPSISKPENKKRERERKVVKPNAFLEYSDNLIDPQLSDTDVHHNYSWVAISTVGCKQATIKLFDSMSGRLATTAHVNIDS